MAVVSVNELHQRRRSSIKDGKPSHTRAFIVITDDINDGTAVAIKAEGVPVYGEDHPDDDACSVTSIEADPVNDSSNHFEVTCEYTTTDTIFVTIDNPLDRPPEVSWNSSEATCSYFLDCSNPPKPVVNSAGEPFDAYLEREVGELTITITMNEETYDAAEADQFSHTINDGPVIIDSTTFAEGKLKLSPIQASKVKERIEQEGVVMELTYYKKTYNLKARREGWNDKPLDTGLNEKIGDLATGFKLKPILDATNQPIKKAAALNGQGKKQSGDPNETPVTLEFEPYPKKAWSFPWNNAEAWAA
jgi:hypothetical protein